MTQSNSVHTEPIPKFSFGRLCYTKAVMERIVPEDASQALERHGMGDWGDHNARGKQENDDALQYGGRLLSVYRDRKGVEFWIITEAHRNMTTVLLPADY